MYRLYCCILFVFIEACGQHDSPANKLDTIASKDSLPVIAPATRDSTTIDAVVACPGHFKTVLENEYVRVVEYSLKPGERDSIHTHPPKTSYVVSGGLLRVFPENEAPFDSEEITGHTEWAGSRGRHYVQNIGKTTVTILLTEIKGAK